MGGDSYCSSLVFSEDGSVSDHGSVSKCAVVPRARITGDDKGLRHCLEDNSVNDGVRVSDSGELRDVLPRMTSIEEAAERQRSRVYTEVLRSYEDLHGRIHRLVEAKYKISSYTPGSFADKAPCMDISEYDLPNTTSLLLIGPKASGKSSLVNKISSLLEDDIFLPGRAQVSCSSSSEDGTYFLHKYIIPRDSGSFCLYDTRGLSLDSSENLKMIRRWMTKGVHHGELIRRKSDSRALKAQLKCRTRRRSFSSQATRVGFVIFVVNGLSVLESMNSSDEKKKEYAQMISANFNNPLLSFKDDKPAIVITHGDLLPLSDRVRVRAYLGELLGIPPTGQIFDIPENDDPATKLTIFDMLIYCLDRADRNLPAKEMISDKVFFIACLVFWIIAVMVVVLGFRRRQPPPPPFKVDWCKIRHLWLE